MSFATVRPFLRNQFESLGFREWNDGFNFANIPSNLLDKSFHIESGPRSGGPANQIDHDFSYPVVIRVFKKGFRYPGDALDDADATIDTVYGAVLNPVNSLGTDIKDIVPDTVSTIQLGPTNDNAIIIEFNLTIILIECYA